MPANNSIEILTSISKSVSMIVGYLSPQNTDEDSVSKLSRGVSSPSSAPASVGSSIKADASSISAMVVSLSGLPASVKKVAGLSGKTLDEFKDVLVTVTSSVNATSRESKNIDFSSIEKLKKGVSDTGDIVKMVSTMSLGTPLAIVGAGGLSVLLPLLVKVMSKVSENPIDEQTLMTINGIKDSVKPLTQLVKESLILTAACSGLGAFVAKGGKDLILAGLGTLAVTMSTLTLIIGLTGVASKKMKDFGAIEGVKSITVLTLTSIGLVAACVGLGTLIAKGDTGKILINGLTVLAGTLGVLTVLIGMTALAGKIIKGTGAMGAVTDIITLTVASMGIVVASKFLGDFVAENSASIWTGLGSTTAVIAGIMGIAFVASKFSKSATKGVIALAAVEAIALGATGIMFAASKLSEELKGKEKDITLTLLGVGGVLTAFGGIAAAASFIMPYIVAGSAALGASEIMAFGTIGLVKKIIELDRVKNEVGIGWSAIAKDVAGIGGVVSAFGLVATAFSLLTIPITLAMPAMVLSVGFAKKSMSVVREVLEISKNIESFGGIDKLNNTIKKDLPSLISGFTVKNFAIPMSIMEMAKLKMGYKSMASVTSSFMLSVEAISKIANIGELTSDGKIKPVLYINPKTGEIKYGNAVDIKEVASVICDTFKIFVNNMNYGIRDLGKMVTGAAMFRIIGNIVNPVTKFVDMISGFVGGLEGSDYVLTSVKIDDDGKLIYGPKVPVKKTAESIVSAISSFVEEVYGEKNAEKWASYIYGDRNAFQKIFGTTNNKTKAVSKIGGILGNLISPISDFVELVSNFESSSSGKLVKVILNPDGTITRGGEVDIVSVSDAIGKSITTFVKSIYGGDEIEISKSKRKSIETVLNDSSSILSMLKEFSDDKNIDLKRLDDVYSSIHKGSDSILNISSSIKDMDAVLNSENERRKKNIDELGSSLEKLLAKFSGVDDSIKTLYNLIIALQSMDPERISNVISSIKGGNAFLKDGGLGKSSESAAQGAQYRQPVSNVSSISKTDIAEAISMALDGIRVSGGSVSEEDSGDVALNAFIGAFRNMQFELQK